MKKIILILILMSGFLYGQIIDSGFNPNKFAPSLFNMNDLEMNHSVSFSTGFSSGQSFYQSVYTNQIKYQFNSKLSLNLDLNFVNFGTGSMQNWEFDSNNDNQTMVLPNMQLNYRPTENILIQVEYNQYPRNSFLFRR